MGTRYSPPRNPPTIPYPGYTSLPPRVYSAGACGYVSQRNMVVGLKSVDQVSLCTRFSGFRGMTEGYNVATAGNPNNHYLIPGNK